MAVNALNTDVGQRTDLLEERGKLFCIHAETPASRVDLNKDRHLTVRCGAERLGLLHTQHRRDQVIVKVERHLIDDLIARKDQQRHFHTGLAQLDCFVNVADAKVVCTAPLQFLAAGNNTVSVCVGLHRRHDLYVIADKCAHGIEVFGNLVQIDFKPAVASEKWIAQ